MPDANDMDLVREFARHDSEAAFTEVVRRHVALVYSVARRCTGNDGDAQDVTQAVFIILARKAAGLREKTLLTGWLYETTRFAAARLLRTNARRHAREQEAYMQSTLNEADLSRHGEATADTAEIWTQLAPHLEAAMSKLAERDRALLVLRFYENKTGPEAAALLGIREDAAHKRAARAIEKLRKIFAQRGVTLSRDAIAGAVSANSVQAVPVAMVKTISTVAVAKGAAATASTLTFVKGALKIMAWTKMKTTIVAGTAILLALTTSTIVIKAMKNNRPSQINYTPSQIHIKTRFIEVSQDNNKVPGFDRYLGNFTNSGGVIANGGRAPSHNVPVSTANPLAAFPENTAFNLVAASANDQILTSGLQNSAPAIATMTGILTDSNAQLVLHALEQRSGDETLGEPEVTTMSGRQTQMSATDKNGNGPVIDVVPTLLDDGYTIKMNVTVSAPDSLSAKVNVWDGQTIVLSAIDKTDTNKLLIVFVTATMVDPAGNRVHSDDELSFAQKRVPPQK